VGGDKKDPITGGYAMKNCLVAVLILVLAAGVAACGGGKGKALASVGGTKITEGDLDQLAKLNPRLKPQLATEFGKKRVVDNLVEEELLYKASTKEGMQNSPGVKEKLELFKKVIISQEYLDKKLSNAAKKYYDEHKNEFEKLQLGDILIKFKKDEKDAAVKRSEKDALDLANKARERVSGGEKFEDVAKELSDDAMTNKRGGDLGFASRNEPRLTRKGYGPLLEKAFTMKVGEVAGPIKTEDGYHVITVTKAAEVQPFEAAEQGILFNIRATAKNELVEELKKKYKVEYFLASKEGQQGAAAQPQMMPPAGMQPPAQGAAPQPQTPPAGIQQPSAPPQPPVVPAGPKPPVGVKPEAGK
jgi:peptidyl-prolyl cis-trans isomerase C